MNYANCQVEDLLTDPAFVRWVKTPDPESNEFWAEVLRTHPHQRATIQQARSVLLALRFTEEPVSQALINEEWSRFQRNQTDTPIIPLRSYRQWWLAAASLAGLLIGLLWWVNRSVPDTVYQTAYGETRQLSLPDGSTVTLNANSEVRLPHNWQSRPVREVWFKGEGFFHVVKRPGVSQSRFIVHTGELAVEVLGTAFNVVSRHQQADVSLQSGAVRLQFTQNDTARLLRMKPGDAVRYQPATGQLKRRQIRVDQMAAWTRGILILDGMTLGELGQLVEDTYGQEVIIRTPSLSRRVLSGSVPMRNEQSLLNGIAVALNVAVRVEKDTIVFGN